MLITLLRIFCNKEARKNLGVLKESLSAFAVAELRYSSQVASIGLENVLLLVVLATVLYAAVFGFIVVLFLTLAFVLPELIPSLSRGGAFALVSLFMMAILYALFSYIKHRSIILKELIAQYLDHWRIHES